MQVANTESFNYAYKNNSLHTRVDVDVVKPYDPEYRSKMMYGYDEDDYSIKSTKNDYEQEFEKDDDFSET